MKNRKVIFLSSMCLLPGLLGGTSSAGDATLSTAVSPQASPVPGDSDVPTPMPGDSPIKDSGTLEESLAIEKINVIQPELQWINAEGASAALPFRYEGDWTLQTGADAKEDAALGVRRPWYELKLKAPEGYRFGTVEPAEVDPHLRISNGGEEVGLSIGRKLTRLKVLLKSERAGKKSKERSGSLLVRFVPERPAFWTQGSCSAMGWSWNTLDEDSGSGSPSTAPLYLAAGDCDLNKEGRMTARVLWSPGITLISADDGVKRRAASPDKQSDAGGPRKNSPASAENAESAPVSGKGQKPLLSSALLETGEDSARVGFLRRLQLELQERTGANEVSPHRVEARYDPDRRVARFTGAAGAGLSFLAYSEEPLQVQKSFLAATVKGGLNYWLVPSHVDLAFSGYFSAVPFSLASASGSEKQPDAHFYGLNLRSGYQLTPDQHRLGPWQLKFSLGYYFWGMITPPESYGVNMTTGPQVFVSLGSIPGRRPWGAYIKIAPISDDPLAASLRSRELAVGGSIGVPWFGRQQPWVFAVDLAQTEMRFAQAINEIGLTVVSISVGRSF